MEFALPLGGAQRGSDRSGPWFPEMLFVAWLNECVMPGAIWQWGRGRDDPVSRHKTCAASGAHDQDPIAQPDRRMDADCEAVREECLGISMQNSGVWLRVVS